MSWVNAWPRRSCWATPSTWLPFYHNVLFKDQKKHRKKVEWPDERLPTRSGRRTSPATRFSNPVVHRLCAPDSHPGGQWCTNTAAWSTGRSVHGPDGLPPAPSRRAAPAGLAAQVPGGPRYAIATAAPPRAKHPQQGAQALVALELALLDATAGFEALMKILHDPAGAVPRHALPGVRTSTASQK